MPLSTNRIGEANRRFGAVLDDGIKAAEQVAKVVLYGETGKVTLEIGAGTLNQLRYEPDISPDDIIEPFRELYEGGPDLKRIRFFYTDIAEILGNQRL